VRPLLGSGIVGGLHLHPALSIDLFIKPVGIQDSEATVERSLKLHVSEKYISPGVIGINFGPFSISAVHSCQDVRMNSKCN